MTEPTIQDVITVLEQFADLGNWVSATAPMGDTVSGWAGRSEPWVLARHALEALTRDRSASALHTPEGLGGIVNEDVLMCLAAESDRGDLEDGTRNILRRAHVALVKALRQAEGLCDICGQSLGDAYCVRCASALPPHDQTAQEQP